MKILFSCLQYDDYKEARGESFEYLNFYSGLKRLPGAEVLFIPFERILEVGRKRFNEEIVETVRREKPDFFFAFMLSDEFTPEALDRIKTLTHSVGWFADDHWRFDNYSRYYAPHFSLAVTTYSGAVERYKNAGIPNVIHSQWGVNADLYTRTKWTGTDAPPEVSFVGTWSRPRARILTALRDAGIPVMAYGSGWKGGKVSHEKMLEIFSNSKINLALNPAPAFWNINSLGRLFFRRSVDRIVPDFHFFRNIRSLLHRGIPQIKSRHFEIPACGGFTITSPADDIGSYFVEDKEMVFYRTEEELIEKVRYYLVHLDEREKIANAGYKRALRDHTYEKRFSEVVNRLFSW